jgi:PKD-like domain
MKKHLLSFSLFMSLMGGICAQNTRYMCYDESGNRVNRATLSCAVLPTCADPVVITGKTDVCSDGIYTYSIATTLQATYTWVITGGSIMSGQNTNKLSVKWYTGVGKVELSMAK